MNDLMNEQLACKNPNDDVMSYFPLGTWWWSRLGKKRRERGPISFSFFF